MENNTTTHKKGRRGQRLTPEQKEIAQNVFLTSFAQNANVTAACRTAGIDRSSFYRWQEKDETFGFCYKQAEAEANDVIRAAIFKRAILGIDEPLHYLGKLVTDEQKKPVTVKKYSDTLLIFLAKARMPEFRERQQVEMSGPGGGPIQTTQTVEIYKVRLPDNGRTLPAEKGGDA
jgi:hypothetical protein